MTLKDLITGAVSRESLNLYHRRNSTEPALGSNLMLTSLSFLEPAAATREEMSNARLPLAYRDSCAHLLIPLNRCRVNEYYLPWKCEVRRPNSIYDPSNLRLQQNDGC